MVSKFLAPECLLNAAQCDRNMPHLTNSSPVVLQVNKTIAVLASDCLTFYFILLFILPDLVDIQKKEFELWVWHVLVMYAMFVCMSVGDPDLNINNGSPIYGTGPWDTLTVLVYAVIMILCFNSLCFLIEVRSCHFIGSSCCFQYFNLNLL